MTYQPLKYVFKSTGDPKAPTLLLLHGTGGDENDLLPLAAEFGEGIHLLGVRGNVSENGMPRFFRRLQLGVFDEEDVRFRTRELVDFIKTTATVEDFDPGRIIALGYSNGANIAGSTLIMYPDFLAGALLFRPMQPLQVLPKFRNHHHTPLFFSSGALDPTVGKVETDRYVGHLQTAGFEVAFHQVHAGHNLIQEDITLAHAWFTQRFGKEPGH